MFYVGRLASDVGHTFSFSVPTVIFVGLVYPAFKGLLISQYRRHLVWGKLRTELEINGASLDKVISVDLWIYVLYNLMFDTPGKLLAMQIDGLPTFFVTVASSMCLKLTTRFWNCIFKLRKIIVLRDQEASLESAGGVVVKVDSTLTKAATRVNTLIRESKVVPLTEVPTINESGPAAVPADLLVSDDALLPEFDDVAANPSPIIAESAQYLSSTMQFSKTSRRSSNMESIVKYLPQHDAQQPPSEPPPPQTNSTVSNPASASRGKKFISAMFNTFERTISVMEQRRPSPTLIGVEGLIIIVSEFTTKLAAISLYLIFVGLRSSWLSCLGSSDLIIIAIKSATLLSTTLVVEIPYTLWEGSQAGYSVDDVIALFQEVRLNWQVYGSFLCAAATAVFTMLAVEFGMFSHNSCLGQ
ncbi:hypothetical protein HDU76_000546 [Blyttiomyces sp. JEL0837]|nr:hypothetical protein HDU76_000546 [Blyttiomyces sp. JEL0837]